MGKNSNQHYSWKAENNVPAFCAMSADTSHEFYAAIIPLMAVIFIAAVRNPLVIDGLISIILGVIILMVRGKIKPVSRTR